MKNRSIVVNDAFYHKALLEYYAARYIFEEYYKQEKISLDYIPKNDLKKLVQEYDINDLYEMLLLQVDNKCREKGIEKSIEILTNNSPFNYFYLLHIVKQKSIFGKNLLKPLFNNVCKRLEHPYHELLYYTVKYNLYKELLSLANEVKDKINYVYSFVQDILILYSDINIKEYNNLYNVDKFKNDHTKRYNHLISYYKEGKKDNNFYYKKDEYKINKINDDKLIGHIIVNSQKSLSNKIMRYVLGISVIDEKDFYKDMDCYYKKKINTLIIPYKIERLESFSAFESLKKIIFSNKVTSIGSYAFWKCSSLTCIELPSSVTSIGEYAFWECNSLTSIKIPSSVISIGFEALSYCSNLTIYCEVESKPSSWHYNWNDSCPVYWNINESHQSTIISDIEYMIYLKSFTAIVINYTGNASVLKLPSIIKYDNNEYNVKSIGSFAFSSCSSLISIVIPEGVTSIALFAFRGCSNLTSIELPSSVTSIGSTTFENCSGLENVYYDGTIEDWCNIGFSTMQSNPMFYATHFYMKDSNNEYKELTEIVIPDTITLIRASQFCGFSSLKSITLSSNITSIGYSAFYNCSSLTSIVIPSSVTSIGSFAFFSCSSLRSIEIPSSVTGIGYDAFYGCSNLTIFRKVESKPSIWDSSWNDSCPVYWNINESHQVINTDDIEYMIYLESFTAIVINYTGNASVLKLPSIIKYDNSEYNVKSIGSFAFFSCSSLTSIELPSSVTSIGEWAFSRCSSLTNVYYDGTIEDWCNITFSSYDSNPMYYATHFYMKDSNNEYKELTEIVIPDTIDSIGDYQFYNFTSLKSITIPSSVTSIGKDAFCFCMRLLNVYFDGTIEDWCNIRFGNKYSNPMSCATHFYMKDSIKEYKEATELIIPNTITSISDYRFYNFTALKSITLSSNVISVGEYAFYNCSSLKSIEIPLNVTSIGGKIFNNCKMLKEFKISENFIDEIPSMFDEDSDIIKEYNKKNYIIEDGYIIIKVK